MYMFLEPTFFLYQTVCNRNSKTIQEIEINLGKLTVCNLTKITMLHHRAPILHQIRFLFCSYQGGVISLFLLKFRYSEKAKNVLKISFFFKQDVSISKQILIHLWSLRKNMFILQCAFVTNSLDFCINKQINKLVQNCLQNHSICIERPRTTHCFQMHLFLLLTLKQTSKFKTYAAAP